MAGKLPPLNLVFWAGESVGKSKENDKFSKTLKGMMEICSKLHFSNLFNTDWQKYEPDIIVFGEVFPDGHDGERFHSLACFNTWLSVDTVGKYKGKIFSLSPHRFKDSEYFFVAYNIRTVAEPKLKLSDTVNPGSQRRALEITVYPFSETRQKEPDRGKCNFPYRIIGCHIESTKAEERLGCYLTEYLGRKPSDNFHLLIGDTNISKSVTLPKGAQEINFENPNDGKTIHNQMPTKNNPIDRAWISSGINAKGRYLKTLGFFINFNFNKDLIKKLGPGVLSNHPIMCVRISR